MENYGNTCYANACLQCLRRCPPTVPAVDRAVLGPEEHERFIRSLSQFGEFGLFPCDAHELLLAILDGVDAYTGEERTALLCGACGKSELRVVKSTIISVYRHTNLRRLLTSSRPDVVYKCDCGEPYKARTTYYAAECLVLHFVAPVTLNWVQSVSITGMLLVGVVFYAVECRHYTAYCPTAGVWRTYDDCKVYPGEPAGRPYMAFFRAPINTEKDM